MTHPNRVDTDPRAWPYALSVPTGAQTAFIIRCLAKHRTGYPPAVWYLHFMAPDRRIVVTHDVQQATPCSTLEEAQENANVFKAAHERCGSIYLEVWELELETGDLSLAW